MTERSGGEPPTPVEEAVETAVDVASRQEEVVVPSSVVCVSPNQVDGSFKPVFAAQELPDDAPAGVRRMIEEEKEEEERRLAAEREVDVRDEDGAIVFDGQFGGARRVRLPADVPVPSRELVRRHRASGHSPYRPWCAHCIQGAANLPSHGPRGEPIGDVPELHCDYAFFR